MSRTVSELASSTATRLLGQALPTLPRQVARSTYSAVVVAGAVLAVIAVPVAVPSIASAGWELWLLAALALASDICPVRVPPFARRSTDYVMSVCVCFAILVLYGAAAAVVVEILAVAVAARRMHLTRRRWVYLTARLACSFAAAGLVAALLGLTGDNVRGAVSLMDVLAVALVGLVFTLVSCAINVVAMVLLKATSGQLAVFVRFDVLARASVVTLGTIIASAQGGWLLLLIVVVLGWTQLARMLADLERRIEHDSSTGLLSRPGLVSAITNLSRIPERDTNQFGLILIRLRGVQYVSRNFGHGAAEHMMNAVASRMRAESRPGDVIGRLPGGHIVVLRPNLADESVIDGARRLLLSLSEPVEAREGVPFRVDPIAAVAVAPQHGRDLGQLISHAESALVDAAAHRNVARTHVPKPEITVDERLALLNGLGRAVNDPSHASEIVMLYQPQVSLETGRTHSVEALLRWHPPNHDVIPTDELLRIVEPTGVMQQLTRHVLDRVSAQLADWNRVGLRLRAAVNVSVLDLITDDFDAHLREVLRRHGISPRQLDIEITEGAVVDDPELLDEAAMRLSRVGVGLTLDDFGTGFASLRRLRRLPLAEVKIDRSYVSRIAQSPQDFAMVKAIHDLAHALGLRLVAEGIEDEATVRVLAKLDHVIGQGWYYARPMPSPELIEWLRDRTDYPVNRGPAATHAGDLAASCCRATRA